MLMIGVHFTVRSIVGYDFFMTTETPETPGYNRWITRPSEEWNPSRFNTHSGVDEFGGTEYTGTPGMTQLVGGHLRSFSAVEQLRELYASDTENEASDGSEVPNR